MIIEVEAKMPPGYADGKPVFDSKLENGILTIPPIVRRICSS